MQYTVCVVLSLDYQPWQQHNNQAGSASLSAGVIIQASRSSPPCRRGLYSSSKSTQLNLSLFSLEDCDTVQQQVHLLRDLLHLFSTFNCIHYAFGVMDTLHSILIPLLHLHTCTSFLCKQQCCSALCANVLNRPF